MDEGHGFDPTSEIVTLDASTPQMIVSATVGVAKRIVQTGGAVPAPTNITMLRA